MGTALDQSPGEQGSADADQHPDDRDDPRQPLGERAGQRMASVHDEREAVASERDRDRRGLPFQRQALQIGDQEILGSLQRTEVQRVVQIGERRGALELRVPTGGQRALSVRDVAAGKSGRGERVPETRLRRLEQADHAQLRMARFVGEERLRPRRGSSEHGQGTHDCQWSRLTGAQSPQRGRHEPLARHGRTDELLELGDVSVRRVRERRGRRQRRLDARERLGDQCTRIAHAELE